MICYSCTNWTCTNPVVPNLLNPKSHYQVFLHFCPIKSTSGQKMFSFLSFSFLLSLILSFFLVAEIFLSRYKMICVPAAVCILVVGNHCTNPFKQPGNGLGDDPIVIALYMLLANYFNPLHSYLIFVVFLIKHFTYVNLL